MKFIKKHKQDLLVLLFFIIAVAIFYGNTLRNGFVLDDHFVIETNVYAHSLKYLPKVIDSCTWESVNNPCSSALYYRPLMSLSYLLTYQISPSPWAFAFIRLVYFIIVIFLIFTLVKLLTKNFLIAFFSSLIFLIHPINNEAVNISVPDLLYAIFAILATIYFFLYRKNKKLRYFILVCLFYAFGMLSKEHAILLPFIFLTLDLIYFKQTIFSIFKWKNLKPYIVCIVIFLMYIWLRFLMLGYVATNNAANITHNLTIMQFVYIFFYLFALYVKAVLWPYPLNFWHIFDPSYRFWDLRFLAGVVISFGFGWLCFVSWKKKWKTMLFALIWFFVFLFPSMAFAYFVGGDNKFAERYAFTSMIGFSILIAIAFEWLWKNLNKGKMISIGLISAISLLSFFYIYNHNVAWRSDISIEVDTLKKSPDADGLWYNLALAYRQREDLELAKKQLMHIINRNVWEDIYEAYYTLGDIYRQEGNYEQAVKNLKISIQINPLHKESYNNLGAQYAQRGYLLQSLPYLCKALLIDPNFKDANTNFNYVSSQIQGLDNKSFTLLHNQMLEGTIFKPSPNKDTITLQNKDCSYQQGCILTFNANLKPNEFLFPFLIYANTPNNQVVRIRYSAFNQGKQGYQIALGIDHSFGNTPIHFYIPSCSGIYYEAEIEGD